MQGRLSKFEKAAAAAGEPRQSTGEEGSSGGTSPDSATENTSFGSSQAAPSDPHGSGSGDDPPRTDTQQQHGRMSHSSEPADALESLDHRASPPQPDQPIAGEGVAAERASGEFGGPGGSSAEPVARRRNSRVVLVVSGLNVFT